MNKTYDTTYLKKTTDFLLNLKATSFFMLDLESGNLVLDLGCGNGSDVLELARLMPDVQVIGLDKDPELLEVARKNLASTTINNASFIEGDVYTLPFNENSINAIRVERVFQHLEQPEKAMEEIKRVLSIEGNLVIVETDWSTLNLYSGDIEIENKVVAFLTGKFIKNGYAAKKIMNYFIDFKYKKIQLQVITITLNDFAAASNLIRLNEVLSAMIDQNYLSLDEKEAWLKKLNYIADAKCFVVTLNMVLISGKK